VAKASGTKRWLRAMAAASAAAAATGLPSWLLLARRHERSSEGVLEACGLTTCTAARCCMEKLLEAAMTFTSSSMSGVPARRSKRPSGEADRRRINP